jgi:NAD-dependent DNA ligase
VDNKKVKNARGHIYDGISFKSGLEVTAYKELMQEGFNPEYVCELKIDGLDIRLLIL